MELPKVYCGSYRAIKTISFYMCILHYSCPLYAMYMYYYIIMYYQLWTKSIWPPGGSTVPNLHSYSIGTNTHKQVIYHRIGLCSICTYQQPHSELHQITGEGYLMFDDQQWDISNHGDCSLCPPFMQKSVMTCHWNKCLLWRVYIKKSACAW